MKSWHELLSVTIIQLDGAQAGATRGPLGLIVSMIAEKQQADF